MTRVTCIVFLLFSLILFLLLVKYPEEESYAGKRLLAGRWRCTSNEQCDDFNVGNTCRNGYCWQI